MLIDPDSAGAMARLSHAIEERLIGRSPLVERLMIGLLTGGHLLVEGVPGLAKTRSVRLLADVADGLLQAVPPDGRPLDGLAGRRVHDASADRGALGEGQHELVRVGVEADDDVRGARRRVARGRRLDPPRRSTAGRGDAALPRLFRRKFHRSH